jgi:hypothetical protein
MGRKMTFKLSRDEIKTKATLVDEIRTAYKDLEDQVADFNTEMEVQKAIVENKLSEYNKTLDDARAFVSEIESRITDEVDEQSEKWAESDKAEAVSEWRDKFQEIDLDDLALSLPDGIDLDDPDHGTELEELPEEP